MNKAFKSEMIIDLLFRSDEMREFLKTRKFSEDTLVDLVMGSDLDLESKENIFCSFLEENEKAKEYIDEIRNALKQLEESSTDIFFILKTFF